MNKNLLKQHVTQALVAIFKRFLFDKPIQTLCKHKRDLRCIG